MKWNTVLFDLDGTIINSEKGIMRSVVYALQAMGITEPQDPDLLRSFIGPPLRDSFSRAYGFDPQQADAAVTAYRERYSKLGVWENELYPGIRGMLEQLSDNGLEVILATSKPGLYAEQILKQHGIHGLFRFICGSELDGSREDKAEVIAYILEQNSHLRPEQCVMVGDRHYDVDGAQANGIPCVGVTYGFGSLEELRSAGAVETAASTQELCAILL